MFKRILSIVGLASLAGCQAPQATTTLPSIPNADLQAYQAQQAELSPSIGQLKQPLDRHRMEWYLKHGFVLVPDVPEALVDGVELKPAVAPDQWDTAMLRFDSADTPGLSQSLQLRKDVELLGSGTSYVATGSLLATLPPGTYTCTTSLWRDGASGSLVGEEQKSLKLVDGSNDLKLSPAASGNLGLLGFDPASAAPGATVSLSGAGFSVLPDQDGVTLGGQPVPVAAATSTRLTVVTPNLAPGTYVWWVQVGSGMVGKTGFTVTSP